VSVPIIPPLGEYPKAAHPGVLDAALNPMISSFCELEEKENPAVPIGRLLLSFISIQVLKFVVTESIVIEHALLIGEEGGRGAGEGGGRRIGERGGGRVGFLGGGGRFFDGGRFFGGGRRGGVFLDGFFGGFLFAFLWPTSSSL
jgi:hypothetical protein